MKECLYYQGFSMIRSYEYVSIYLTGFATCAHATEIYLLIRLQWNESVTSIVSNLVI